MIIQKNLDEIINACGISRYENIATSGYDDFFESCSESILKKGDDLKKNDLQNLLYLLKYLYQYWPVPEKKVRSNKQLCLKTLFVILLTGKLISETRDLLEQGARQISDNWEITPNEYPFLAKEEKDKILSELKTISKQADVHAKFSSVKFEKMGPKSVFSYCPAQIYNEFILIYETFCRNYNLEKDDEKFLKAIFIAVNEQHILKEVPGILKILPLHYCMLEARRLLPPNPVHQKTKGMNSSCCGIQNNIAITAGHRLLIKEKTTKHYESIPKWSKWFFLAGQKIAAVSSSCYSLIIGLSLPTKFYAALFLLLGYETWNAKKIMAAHNGNESYFNHLAKCENNEALLILVNKHWKRCWFKSIEIINGEKYIKVDVPGTHQYFDFIPCSNIMTLRKAVDTERKVAANQTGFGMNGLDFLVSYYGKAEDDILKLLNQDKPLYAVIGSISTLKNEIEKEPLYIYSNEEYIKFSCQDILRFKNFTSEFDFPRGIVFSSSKESEELSHHTFPVVVYDGSLAYLNRQGDLKNNVEIVLLDRSEPQFTSACSELMVRYSDRSEDVDLFDEVPATMELVAFKEE